MNKFSLIAAAAIGSVSVLSACSTISDSMKPKPEYIGPTPPAVKLYSKDKVLITAPSEFELPPSIEQEEGQNRTRYNKDGIPYGHESQYRNCVNSPYEPHRRLSTAGYQDGDIVYDPFDGRPFILP